MIWYVEIACAAVQGAVARAIRMLFRRISR
jgi:hypothetical protein